MDYVVLLPVEPGGSSPRPALQKPQLLDRLGMSDWRSCFEDLGPDWWEHGFVTTSTGHSGHKPVRGTQSCLYLAHSGCPVDIWKEEREGGREEWREKEREERMDGCIDCPRD